MERYLDNIRGIVIVRMYGSDKHEKVSNTCIPLRK